MKMKPERTLVQMIVSPYKQGTIVKATPSQLTIKGTDGGNYIVAPANVVQLKPKGR